MRIVLLLIFCCVELFSTHAGAGEVVEKYSPIRSEWSVIAGTLNVDKTIAKEEGIDDVGYTIGGSYTGYKSFLKYSGGIALIIISDNDKFSQDVENIFSGDESTEDSSIDAGTLYVELGSQYAFGSNKAAIIGLMIGYSYFDIDRTISNCSNCGSENIDINSSAYLKPFVSYRFTESISFALEYSDYFEEQSFDSAITAKLSFKI